MPVVGAGCSSPALGPPWLPTVHHALHAPGSTGPGSWFGVDLGRAGGFLWTILLESGGPGRMLRGRSYAVEPKNSALSR